MNSLAQLVGRGAFACSFAFALLACSPSETAAVATSPLLGAQVGHADAAAPSAPVADSGRFRSEYSAAKECMDQTAVGELPSDVKFVFVDGIFDLPHFGRKPLTGDI